MLALTPRLQQPVNPLLTEQVANPTLARVLAGRGITDASSLDVSLSRLLPAMQLHAIDAAVALLDKAIDSQQRLLIVGDFDCDGATSTALMVRVLREMGAVVEFLVPDRFKYGYGLTPPIVDLGIELHQPDWIITVDNGISSYEGVNHAKSKGIGVIITDHHLTTQAPPAADAVVNPNQLDCNFASKSLVGVGVAFYVLGTLAKVRRQANKSTTQVSQYLDLVALGTVADVGVLDDNNRILVHHGLAAIRQKRCCIGILALLEQAGRQAQTVSAQDFGFIIAPRINAAGRMDNMRIGIECLLTDDWGEAQRLAYQLDKLNQQRRHVENNMRQQADEILQNLPTIATDTTTNAASDSDANDDFKRCILVYQDDWHQGVIGIVAGRLKETYHLPAIVFAPADTAATGDDDYIKGSARSISGIHIRDAIESVAHNQPQLIAHFGGHAMAAGLTLKKRHYPAFCQAFTAVMATVADEVFTETLYTDGALSPTEFSLNFYETLTNLAIWGHGFSAPVFDGVFVIQDFRVLKERHLKLWLSHPQVPTVIDAIWFQAMLDDIDLTSIHRGVSQIHLLYSLEKNDYNNQLALQLNIKKACLL